MANTSMVDPVTLGFAPGVLVMDKSGMQGGNMFEWMTVSPHVVTACQAGLISAGAACDMLILSIVRSRARAHSSPSAAAPQQLQPVKPIRGGFPLWCRRFLCLVAWRLPHQVAERVLQLPHMFVVTSLVAFAGLCCALCGARLTGVSKRRRQLKSAPIAWTCQEHEEPDAEPRSIKRSTKLRRTTGEDGRLLVPAKMLGPNRPVASATDESEGEDFMGSSHGPVLGNAGFVAQQTNEHERVLEFFRMYTEGSARLVDENANEELTRETQVVPDGLVRSSTMDLERHVERRPSSPSSLQRRVSFA